MTVKIGFICDTNFDVLTPFQNTIADSESAICFLAIELAKLGHKITIFSRNTNNITAFDVRCRSISLANQTLNIDKAILEPDFNALIAVNIPPEFIANLKGSLPYKVPIYLWTEHDHLHPINQGLSQAPVIEALDGIICVSDWQRVNLLRAFAIPRDKIAVRFYAISPFFEELYADGREFVQYKPKDPQFAYIANPLTGLDVLLDTFGDVTNNYPSTTLNIYNSADYNSLDASSLTAVFDQVAKIKGFQHVGSLSPTQLAAHLRGRTIFAYPNTTEITASISIMNAMAAGLYVVTSNLGAIPEYCTEHGKCVIDKNLRGDSLDSFIGQVLAICQSQVHSPSAFFDYCYKQAVDMNKKHSWRIRAREWVHLLSNAT